MTLPIPAGLVAVALGLLTGCGESGQQDSMVATSSDRVKTAGPPGLTRKPRPALERGCRSVRERSREQAVRRRVICPPLTPAVAPLRLELACGARVCAKLADGYQVGVWSSGVEHDELGAHWSFARGSPAALRWYLQGGAPRYRPLSTTHTMLAGTRVTVYRMPRRAQAFYAGHVVLSWRTGADEFHLTMHGWSNEPDMRLMAEALIRESRAGTKGQPSRGRPEGGARGGNGTFPIRMKRRHDARSGGDGQSRRSQAQASAAS